MIKQIAAFPEFNDSFCLGKMSFFCNETPRRVPSIISDTLNISLYSVIFFLSITGNLLVIVTLIQNRKMRTVTNVFLLNLAASDLLLSICYMPFTLIPKIMRNFIFGYTICVILRYCQSLSAAVNCFTLVSISLERFCAICRPFRSRGWQTLSHSYKIIALCWLSAIVLTLPVGVFTQILKIEIGNKTLVYCREVWPDTGWEKMYAILLDVVLLVFPLGLMSVFYGSVVERMWKSMRRDQRNQQTESGETISAEDEVETTLSADYQRPNDGYVSTMSRMRSNCSRVMSSFKASKQHAARRKVIAMLFVLVLEYFICWTPLYVIITWETFDRQDMETHFSPQAISFIYLLANTSSCCNPITYSFMNEKFRQGFLDAFSCFKRLSCHRGCRRSLQTNSFNNYKSRLHFN